MRLINADALDYEVMHFFMAITGNPKQSAVVNECKRSFRNMIDEQPTVEVEPKWIPCSKRLPKTNGVYLVTRKIAEDNCVWFITDAVYFDGQNTWHNDNRVNHGRDYLKDVIAWMEKPEPYKIN